MDISKEALALYKPPFKFYYGYIYDSQDNVLADTNGGDDVKYPAEEGFLAVRVRGWGRIQQVKTQHDNGDLQDAVGAEILKALNAHWEANT